MVSSLAFFLPHLSETHRIVTPSAPLTTTNLRRRLIMARAKISQVKYLFQEHVYDFPHFFDGSSGISLLNTDAN